MRPQNYITLYAEDFDRDTWKDYEDACGTWGATSIRIYFELENVEELDED